MITEDKPKKSAVKPSAPKAKSAKPKGKKKPRRRIHRGRMALVLSILAVIIIVIMYILSRCSNDAGNVFRSAGQQRQVIPTAAQAGREDAMKAVNTAAGSMQRQNALLFIHSRESQMRTAGYNHAADDYITSAREILVSKGVIK